MAEEVVDRLALVRARRALEGAGLSGGASLTRASSTRNEVYLGDEYVVRVNKQPNQRLRREAMVCADLPNYSWTPKVMAYGGKVGADFLIVKRQRGQNLSHMWPYLDKKLRYRAIRFIAAGLRSLHAIPTPASASNIDIAPHLFDSFSTNPVEPLIAQAENLKAVDGVDKGLMNDLQGLIEELSASLPTFDRSTLIHGDLTFENILWDGEKVTAFVDFEWCRGAPRDLDFDVMMRFCAYPQAHVPEKLAAQTRPEDYVDIPGWLASELPEIFDAPGFYDRLRLYAFSYDLRELRSDPTPPQGRGGPLHPYNRLRSMMGGGGYLHDLMSNIGVTVR